MKNNLEPSSIVDYDVTTDLPANVCISCGAGTEAWLAMPLDAKKATPTSFGNVVRCSACELGAVSPLPTTEEVASHYRLPVYYTHGGSHMPAVHSNLLDRLLTKLVWWFDHGEHFGPSTVGLPRGARVCDLGCGHGDLLRRFLQAGCEVIGVDPDPIARAHAGAGGVRVLPGTAEYLPPEIIHQKFDLVIMTHALEHCRDPVAALANAYHLTKPGGSFYCEVPNSACAHFRMFSVCSEMFDVPRHLYFFTPSSLQLLLEGAGFSCERMLFSGYTRHHSPSWRAWERSICRQIGGERSTDHTFIRSIALAMSTLLAPAAEKYDCMGILAHREQTKPKAVWTD